MRRQVTTPGFETLIRLSGLAKSRPMSTIAARVRGAEWRRMPAHFQDLLFTPRQTARKPGAIADLCFQRIGGAY